MSLELMLNGINVALVAFSRTGANLDGSVFVFFIMTVAASEVAVGLGFARCLVQEEEKHFFRRT